MIVYMTELLSKLENKCFKTWPLRSSNLMLSFFISTIHCKHDNLNATKWRAWCHLGGSKSVLPSESARHRVFLRAVEIHLLVIASMASYWESWKHSLRFLVMYSPPGKLAAAQNSQIKVKRKGLTGSDMESQSVSQVDSGRSCRVQELLWGLDCWMMRPTLHSSGLQGLSLSAGEGLCRSNTQAWCIVEM